MGSIAALGWLAGKSNPMSSNCYSIETLYINYGHTYPCVMLLIEKYATRYVNYNALHEVLSGWSETMG